MENREERRRRSPRRGRRRRSSAEAAALGRKVRELRRLVPGGATVRADRLLVRTADYIVRLWARVELLRALSALIHAEHGHADGDAATPLAS